MYRMIVAWRVRRTWARLQQHDASAVLDQLANGFEHRFAGEHALGGIRRTRAAQSAWFARLFDLMPDIRFGIRDVLVAGWPWRTRAVAVVDVSLPSHPGYSNVVMQLIEIRWGRITRVENLEDTQRLARLLDQLGASGSAQALAAPIDSAPPAAPR